MAAPNFKRRFLAPALLAACLSPFMAAAQSAAPGSVIPKIINGTAVSPVDSPVALILSKSGKSTFLCTGSLISSNAILTASHCVTRQVNTTSVIIGGRPFAVRKAAVHPGARVRQGLIVDDVAILFLKKPSSKPKLSLLVSRATEPGDSISILGYGLDQFGRVGTLRQGTAVIEQVLSNFIVTLFNSVQLSNSCNGDSGGPATFSYSDPSGLVHSGIIGITSAGTTQHCSVGDFTFYVNTQSPAVLNFIQRQVPAVRLD
jgi:secreted trypsin-like serine protease